MPSGRAGNLRILLVDDEYAVRTVARLILEREGHQVAEACCIKEAQRSLSSPTPAFDLLILDVCLPDGLGTTLGEGLRGRGGRPRVMFMTGDPGWLESLRSGPEPILPKPFTSVQMIQAVTQAIGAEDPAAADARA